MKKLLIVFLALILILGGLFLWKGGHHAVVLAERMEDWLDADAADQTLSLNVTIPTDTAGGDLKPSVRQMSLLADTFWTELGDRTIYGLSVHGCSAYVIGNTLYMDTGAAYALPQPRTYQAQVRDFLTGLLLYGRVTRTDRGYRVELEHEQLRFSADVVLDPDIASVTVDLSCPVDGQPLQMTAVLTPKQTQPHPLPQTVLDAMVRATMEPTMLITEPLEILMPAVQSLLPLKADVTLGVECGILTLSETVQLTIDETATLTRNGTSIPLSLPDGLTELDPLAVGLALLRNGAFTRQADASQFRLSLPAEATAELAAQLVPQIRSLGITFTESTCQLSIQSGKLTGATLTADGTVPFLLTTIPLSFSATFDIQ